MSGYFITQNYQLLISPNNKGEYLYVSKEDSHGSTKQPKPSLRWRTKLGCAPASGRPV